MKTIIAIILVLLLCAGSAFAYQTVEVRVTDADGDTLAINSDGSINT